MSHNVLANRPAIKSVIAAHIQPVLITGRSKSHNNRRLQHRTAVVGCYWWRDADCITNADEPKKSTHPASGLSLWHTDGKKPLAIRWVLVKHPKSRQKPVALSCTDQAMAAGQILRLYLDRWAIEVTFEEARTACKVPSCEQEIRAHLGFETQRQWSEMAVGRTSPCLLGVFSLVVLMAQRLHRRDLPVRQSAWYVKLEPTFADVLAAVRRKLWVSLNSPGDVIRHEVAYFRSGLLETLVEIDCYAA